VIVADVAILFWVFVGTSKRQGGIFVAAGWADM